MTVREMLARMDAKEFGEWMAYYNLEPFGQERDDLHAANIAHWNYLTKAGKDAKLTLRDFLIVPPPRPKQTMTEMMMMAQNATSTLGALGK